MGGFFAPDPPSPSPAPVVVAAPVVQPTTTADDAAAQERLDAIDRNRRGLYGTIATSDSGTLSPTTTGPGAKSLLGD